MTMACAIACLHRPSGISRRILTRRYSITTSEYSTDKSSVLFISPVWPERSSSAAGVRTTDLIESFQQRGYTVSYASPSTPNHHTDLIQSSGVQVFECPPNNEASIKAVLTAAQPAVVIFDRFYAEEMFSFHVKDLLPNALRILDMQDVHFLREGRQQLVKNNASMADILACRPDTTSAACLRELASIYRCDLTLVCSPVELRMLQQHYNVPSNRLVLAPLFAPPSPHLASPRPWTQRSNFLMIGNFRHPPNFDSVRWACREIWPSLRKAIQAVTPREPPPELHLYGSYAPQAASELNNPSKGIHFKGFAPSLDIMLDYRVCLAPLRYGAGLKGKVMDAWWHGLPVCTTPIGSEGMTLEDAAEPSMQSMQSRAPSWGGLCGGTTAEEIINDAVRLYTEQSLWEESQRRGFELLVQLYDAESHLRAIHDAIESLIPELHWQRSTDFVGEMLWTQQLRSTEYFSRWIELKERNISAASKETER